MSRRWSRWVRLAGRLAGEVACCHTFEGRRIGAGLARRLCTECGAVSVVQAPRACWATTTSGHPCRSWARRDSPTPLCGAHDAANVVWIRDLRHTCTLVLIHSLVGIPAQEPGEETSTVRSIDTARRQRQARGAGAPIPAAGLA